MACQSVDFSEIKIILCMQGYPLDYNFVVREIGYWCDGRSGSIPFNVKLSKNHLDVKNAQIVLKYEDEINGVKLKRNFENALAASDIKPVLRTLFHLNSNVNAKFIGIVKNDGLDGLLYKSGLGAYITYLDNLNVMKHTQLPNDEFIRQFLKKNSDNYIICPIHDRLRISEFPYCAKVKAQFLADYISNVVKSQQSSLVENTSKPLQSFLSEFDFGQTI